jgi:HD-like signal output (HDOD) protein
VSTLKGMNQSDQKPGATEDPLVHWRERLNASGLPVFSRTVREIHSVSSNRSTSAKDLSDVIGHDASMAARVIQIANSPLFNLQNRHIDTINAAVVLVGFDAVRDLVISVSVVEEMLKGHRHAQVGRHMARAFHAAAQARSFAKAGGDKNEDVFVAALLKHVGEMAFWSKADAEAEALEVALNAGVPPHEAERRVLGFELSELSQLLAHDWNLGELIGDVLDGRHTDDRRVQHVNFGHEIAQVLERESWDSPQVSNLMRRLAKHLNLKERAVEEMVCANLDDAAAIAKRFGVDALEDDLPVKPEVPSAQEKSTQEEPVLEQPILEQPGQAQFTQVKPTTSGGFNADKMLLVLDLVADGIEQGAGRDELMQQIIDGAHAALGMAHAYFALFSPDRSKLYIKYAAGEAAGALRNLSCTVASNPLLAKATVEKKMTTFTGVAADGAWHRGGHGAVAGIYLGGRSVGVLYGELEPGELISDAQASGFRQLGQQVALVLAQT